MSSPEYELPSNALNKEKQNTSKTCENRVKPNGIPIISHKIAYNIDRLSQNMIFTFDLNKLENLQKIQFHPDKKRALFFAKKQHVDTVYNTTKLEENPFTLPEVQTLLEGITVGGHKVSDEQQVLNQSASYKKLYELVKDEKFILNKKIFCDLNAIVAKDESLEWGVLRNGNVAIGGTEFIPPPAEQLDTLLEQGIKEIKSIENIFLKAFVFFLFGSINQFFWDGNKRTSRLMMNGVLLDKGYPIVNISAKDRLAFNTNMVEFYSTQEGTKLLNFLIDYYLNHNIGIGFD